MDSLDVALVVVAIVFGSMGVLLLTRKDPAQRTVGALLFPFVPAVIFFTAFSSSADIPFVGQLGGAFAGYVVGALLAQKFIKPDIDAEKQQKNIDDLTAELTAAKTEKEQIKAQLDEKTRAYDDLNERFIALQKKGEIARREALPSGIDREYALPGEPDRKVVIRTGGIGDVRDVDVVVSSSNTEMMLPTYFDRSISGTLRYLDATKDGAGYVKDDNLYTALEHELTVNQKLSRPLRVRAGLVYSTPTTELAKNQNIKYVFHAAAVEGEPGVGYQPVPDRIHMCVRHSYDRMRDLAAQAENPVVLESILFPLLGAGSAKLSPEDSAERMLLEIVESMKRTPSVKTTIILAYVETHRHALRDQAAKLVKQNKLVEVEDDS